MTGFGMSEAELNGITSITEIKTVNNRYCDIKVKMPILSLDILQKIENLVQQRICRGSVSVLIKIEDGNDRISEVRLNEDFLKTYLQALYRLKEVAELEGDINLYSLLRCKEIFEFVKKEEDEGKWESIKISLNKALDLLVKSREEEGEKLIKDILERICLIETTLLEIDKEKNDSLKDFQEKLKERIEQLTQNISLDEGRMEMEVAFLVQKSDITEEIARLKCHISQVKKIAETKEPIGKKLEFYTQEMGREINTIGAKSVNQSISQKVILLKDELEKIREQSRNIE